MRVRLVLGMLHCAASLACAGAAPSRVVAARPADDFASIVRALVTDSAMTGAGRAERPVTVTDSVTARLLDQAGVPTAAPVTGQPLLCPASTLANGGRPPGPRGYYARVEIVPDHEAPTDSTVRVVRITHSCRFMYRGELSVFATTAFWKVHLRDARWRIVRLLGLSIT